MQYNLPADEVAYLASLPREEMESRLRALWENGWSLASLGDSIQPQRPKTTIHFWVKRAVPTQQSRILPTPPPKSLTTSVPVKSAPRLRSISPGVPSDIRDRIRELSVLARRYRAKTSPNSPIALANDELTAIARTLSSMGVPTQAIADVAGVSYRAMARRITK